MPSMRRIRLLLVAAVVAVVLILFYTSGIQPPADPSLSDFYQKTKHALDRTRHKDSAANPNPGTSKGTTESRGRGRIPADRDGDGDVDEDDAQAGESLVQRLQAVAQQAKDQANEKGGLRPDAPSKIVGVGSSADGQAKGVKEAEAPFPTKTKEASGKDGKEEVVKTTEQHEAEAELNAILKQSPVIMFSKTYCPFSKRAKGMLLEKYILTPKPFIVELDKHPLGPYLQDLLEAKTGRRTVPNILINGVSIGGSDELVKMDGEGSLAAKFRDLGQRRVEVTERIGG